MGRTTSKSNQAKAKGKPARPKASAPFKGRQPEVAATKASAPTRVGTAKMKVFKAAILDKGIKRPLRAVDLQTERPRVSSKSVGHTIRLLRVAENWSQTELAQRSGLPQATISLIEGGKSLTMENLMAVASALSMSVSRLIKAAERRVTVYGTNKDILDVADSLVAAGWDPGKLHDLLAKKKR